MKYIKYVLINLFICIVFIAVTVSCSRTKITELNEITLDYSTIGNSFSWHSFIRDYNYHLNFYYDENYGWRGRITGYDYHSKPTATLKVNNQNINITWTGLYSRSMPPPWHYGSMDLNSLNLQSGQEISVQLKSSKGISNFTLRLPYAQPQITEAPSIYNHYEDFTIHWELSQVADFQAIEAYAHIAIIGYNGEVEYFKTLQNNLRYHTVSANSLFDEYYLEFIPNINISISNISIKSSENQVYLVTATSSGGIWLDIDYNEVK